MISSLEVLRANQIFVYAIPLSDLGGSFIFKVNCGTWQEDCRYAKDDLNKVGALIAKQLKFNVPVKVCANVVPMNDLGDFQVERVIRISF